MQNPAMKRHPSLKPLSRDHGIGLVCAQNAHKAVRGSNNDRLRLAEQIRAVNRDVILSYLENEQRILSPVISNVTLRLEFQEHHNKVRRLIGELDQLDPADDPGLGLMARVADSLDAYVRWEENFLFPALEKALDAEQLKKLSQMTTTIEETRTRPTQVLHSSIAKQIPSGLPK